MSRDSDEALEVLRGIWTAQGQSGADLGDGGPAKSCKRMSDVGFTAMAGPDGDLHAAWRAQLEREGKLSPGSASLADLVLQPGRDR